MTSKIMAIFQVAKVIASLCICNNYTFYIVCTEVHAAHIQIKFCGKYPYSKKAGHACCRICNFVWRHLSHKKSRACFTEIILLADVKHGR
jgi:hypothetical protein